MAPIKEPVLEEGRIVRFANRTGNDTRPTYQVAGKEDHNGRIFYRLKDDTGGLFLRSSLVPIRSNSTP